MVLKHVVSIGAAIVFGLLIFAAMQLMVATDGMFEKPDRNQTYLNFVRVDTSSQDVATKDRRLPDPPPPPETPPPATPDNSLSNSFDSAAASLSMNMPNIGMGINQGEGPALGTMQVGNGMAGFDTDVIPMVRVPPAYPQRAKQAKLEGYVTMAVTIRPDGTVADVEVTESKPPRLFDSAAVQAMQRWKFRPKIVNGQPQSQRAQQTIEFTLNQ